MIRRCSLVASQNGCEVGVCFYDPTKNNVLLCGLRNSGTLSVNTVAVHRANIMQTLGIHNTAELVVYAIKKGLVTL